ncbi:NAD(P)-dependent oxidoreductase [Bradyrhizobium sp. INPA01-394B]|uniref:NAD(P)-dependent oxidoreductase n=1 Tax=Bradyrhizobium campsiandrae TaxID=1729892 RepID=A0ABR7U543_9BRAD|nr:NAD(P)-dependent oxidoreductase [Bradyrhizobium campsiandrae]MBC9879854.1 NAD(P)-dependent oxidoreductase [Bradyrhizobium campsiandrae]MBC9978539.1 NAD(P)-dependent oxidoreductase [Bradyrhizobium campsiandrae]
MTKNIAVLGLGAMGSRMAANLLKAGHAVTVWNRTPQAAAALVTRGANQARTPKEAADGADVIISMVRDDAASRDVWLALDGGALAGMGSGAIAIESSTVTPGWIRELGAIAGEKRKAFLEAPVVGSRPQAEAGQLIYLVGGDEAVLEQARPVLSAMGSTINHLGPIGSGALVKLCTNALLGVQVTVLAELIGLLTNSGIDTARAIQAIGATAAWSPAANHLSGSMLAGNFTPQFPIELIEKDLNYAVSAAGSPEAAPTIAAALGVFGKAIAKGFGDENMTGVVRMFVKAR